MINQDTTQQTTKVICNAFGCWDKATEKVNVEAGKFGLITLQVCKNCLSKFHKKQ